jgi:hypothetical protein
MPFKTDEQRKAAFANMGEGYSPKKRSAMQRQLSKSQRKKIGRKKKPIKTVGKGNLYIGDGHYLGDKVKAKTGSRWEDGIIEGRSDRGYLVNIGGERWTLSEVKFIDEQEITQDQIFTIGKDVSGHSELTEKERNFFKMEVPRVWVDKIAYHPFDDGEANLSRPYTIGDIRKMYQEYKVNPITIRKRGRHVRAQATGGMGNLRISWDRLNNIFGMPHFTDSDKSSSDWVFQFSNGEIATIYDWNKKKSPQEITDWRIGGNSPGAVTTINKYLQQRGLKENEDFRTEIDSGHQPVKITRHKRSYISDMHGN